MASLEVEADDSPFTASDIADCKKALAEWEESKGSYWKFEVVPNQFKQSLADTDDLLFLYFDEHFGVIGGWDEVVSNLRHLNKTAPETERYKILFIASSGHGYHDLAREKYGKAAWSNNWLKKNGDGTIVWGPDPLLTDLGISQARKIRDQWEVERLNNSAKDPNLIMPGEWVVSPLRRSIDTLIHTWDGLVDLEKANPFISENLRETIGINTCSKRSPRSEIFDSYHKLGFRNDELEANDIYYKDDYRETVVEHTLRINKELQEIFFYKKDIISITSHSCSIRAQLLALGHRAFSVGTGGMIPVFVKATKIGEPEGEGEVLKEDWGPQVFIEYVENLASKEGIRYSEALETVMAM
ncbi:phosphoglycerate mutase [Suhomyces tanzawaensis NRRL Y-17324]|uniref:Phosphoglycerate mutase n=1 Tax=Suhomyces tanzawaensis NRRL Y-17324 TaxID=984487 RepID=A0A1E4SNM1_9ASCO|nr:phosphoglycerate mutase [Suhomyces tanzawaensis NRRL Y-17324]ODV81124.1 phosphoglycerate mutase [Suhomyces tanzawaensis NRRL Y-17324]